MQFHRLVIDICVEGLRDSENVWVSKTLLIPFAPRTGDKIRLYSEINGEEDIELCNVVYVVGEQEFKESQADTSVREALESDTPEVTVDNRVFYYEVFGFIQVAKDAQEQPA